MGGKERGERRRETRPWQWPAVKGRPVRKHESSTTSGGKKKVGRKTKHGEVKPSEGDDEDKKNLKSKVKKGGSKGKIIVGGREKEEEKGRKNVINLVSL